LTHLSNLIYLVIWQHTFANAAHLVTASASDSVSLLNLHTL